MHIESAAQSSLGTFIVILYMDSVAVDVGNIEIFNFYRAMPRGLHRKRKSLKDRVNILLYIYRFVTVLRLFNNMKSLNIT